MSDFYEDPDGLEAIDVETLNRRVQQGDVIVLDVRPADEYAAGHISGAVSIPIGELEERLQELPPGREVVTYCRGPYCLFSRQAVERLRSHGLRAYRMEEGVAEWEERGLPVSAGEPST